METKLIGGPFDGRVIVNTGEPFVNYEDASHISGFGIYKRSETGEYVYDLGLTRRYEQHIRDVNSQELMAWLASRQCDDVDN